MKSLLLALLLCVSGLASATSVVPMPLEEMVRASDHVVVATITGVEMVDGDGNPVTDPDARTGPGIANRMRLRLRVDAVLSTRAGALPPVLTVPLWTMWHYALGDMQAQLAGLTGIFLLKGDPFEPAYPAHFQRALDERREIERLLAAPGGPAAAGATR